MLQISALDGALVVDKPAGCTSHDVVDRVRRHFQLKKVGHCGTLDPNATGLLGPAALPAPIEFELAGRHHLTAADLILA